MNDFIPDGECIPHEFVFPGDEECPVCEGIKSERERIIKLLMTASIELRYWDGEKVRRIEHYTHTAEEAEEELRTLIKGENK